MIGAAIGGQQLGWAGGVPGADDPGAACLIDENHGGEACAGG